MRLYVTVAQFFIRGDNSEASRLAPIHTLLDSRNTVDLPTEMPSPFFKYSHLARACHVAEDSPEDALVLL
jgi:hypothetical protein